ncbi:GAP family protein [Sphaerisporangium sp. TRM90804]|uniref:GAP family protein n=1 Tax=Sphaerisporangium sp. TRM90804 TaxID=3031113 RepID=UPI00244CE670|nr:GAP family protein [Sphaerisporangium sp. TRM90804]MDH2426875.1 GAP family protein [Sphaerisporangium sp. TRM90804]
MTTGLLLALAGLALVDSTSFGTLGIPVYLLLAGERSRGARLLVYLGTLAGFYFLVGAALMLGLTRVMDDFGDALRSPPAYWAQLALGVGLFGLSFWLDPKWRRRHGRPERRFQPRVGGPRVMALLGLTAGLVEVATMLPYLAAIGVMTSAGLTAAQWVPVLAGYVLIMIAPPLLLLGLRQVAGDRLDRGLKRLRDWMDRNSASAVSWTVCVVGVLLALDAAGYLFSG